MHVWHFGDATTDTVNNPLHTYNDSGTFIIKLYIIDSALCGVAIDSSTKTINVYPQVHASFIADTLSGCSPLTVQFINNSSNASSYLWNFGNNKTSTVTNPSLTYDTSGSFTITLIAYSSGGCNDTMIQTNYITILGLPTVTSSFVADTFSGCNPLTVTFTNTSINGTSYLWNFGDSITLNTLNATHTYTDSGTFKVILIATNTGPCGVVIDSSIQKTTIRVDDPIKVTSSFTAEPLSGCAPLAVTFTNSSINGASYYWYFGDGGFDSTKNPIHIYDTGTYHIYLIAYNNTNRCTNHPDSSGLTITVENCELAIPNVFSPNGDGMNDFFNLIADGYFNYHLIIFDRWGLKIFESSNAAYQWNGRVNNTGGECPDGTYYYIFSGNDPAGSLISNKGFISLIR
jgi:gliding motility-associated-like protein